MVQSALTINCAACHGLLEWTSQQRKKAIQPDTEKQRTHQPEDADLKDIFIQKLAGWAMQCLGANLDDPDLWEGWNKPQTGNKGTRNNLIGSLCRIGPSMIDNMQVTEEASQMATMYRCYKNTLLKPWMASPEEIDAYVNSRQQDVSLSALVYKLHFEKELKVALSELSKKHSGQRIVLMDIGAGSGIMLADATRYLEGKGLDVIAVAVEPSAAARGECKKNLVSHESRETHIIEGTIENPKDIKDKLAQLRVPNSGLIIMAKAALHDRALSRKNDSNDANIAQEATGILYRKENWHIIDKKEVSEDMKELVDRWKAIFPGSSQIIMETHLLPTKIIRELSDTIALMPTYIAHCISCQYLLTWSDHGNSIMQTSYKNRTIRPICNIKNNHPLMSISILSD